MLDTYRIRGFDELMRHVDELHVIDSRAWVFNMKKEYGGWVSWVMLELTPDEFFELISLIHFVREKKWEKGHSYEW